MPAATPTDEPFIDECERLIAPQEAEAILRRDLPPSQINSTSDDYTDMSWHAPTARFYVARPALRAPDGYAYPAWVMNALGGIPATIDPMVICAAKTIALSALRLLEDETARDARDGRVRRAAPAAASAARTGSRRSATTTPPIHFRWPEYVTTPRGRDWWIPNNPTANHRGAPA